MLLLQTIQKNFRFLWFYGNSMYFKNNITRKISFAIWIHLNKSSSVVFSSITIFIAKGRLCALTWNSSQILILYKPAAGDWRQNASSKLTSNDFVQRFPRALGQFSLPEVYFQLMKNELRWLAAVCLRDQEVEKRKWREANSCDTFLSRLFLSLFKNRLIQGIVLCTQLWFMYC